MNAQTTVITREYAAILLEWELGFTVHTSSKAVHDYKQGIRTRETTGEKSELGCLEQTSNVIIQSDLYEQVKKEGGSSFFVCIREFYIRKSGR